MSEQAIQLPLWDDAAPAGWPNYVADMRRILRYGGGPRSLRAWYELHRPRRLNAAGELEDVPFADIWPLGDVSIER